MASRLCILEGQTSARSNRQDTHREGDTCVARVYTLMTSRTLFLFLPSKHWLLDLPSPQSTPQLNKGRSNHRSHFPSSFKKIQKVSALMGNCILFCNLHEHTTPPTPFQTASYHIHKEGYIPFKLAPMGDQELFGEVKLKEKTMCDCVCLHVFPVSAHRNK